jgi:glycosyltransferase involved in cell wall biosynthesis
MKLSIITTGKNDSYAINFNQRLKNCLSKLINNIERLDIRDYEIILVDWGSDNNSRLSDVLDIKSNHLKFLYVNEEISKKYSPDSDFSFVHSANSGFRVSSGKYILFIDGDVYMSFESFNTLYNLINHEKENVFYWGSRYHLPFEKHHNVDDFNIIDNEIENYENSWRHDKVNLSGGFIGTAGALLLSRNICEESTCYYEALNKWGFLDIELNSRLVSKYQCDGDLEDNGIKLFHLDHHNIKSGGQSGYNEHTYAGKFTANDVENWGLINENLEIYQK